VHVLRSERVNFDAFDLTLSKIGGSKPTEFGSSTGKGVVRMQMRMSFYGIRSSWSLGCYGVTGDDVADGNVTCLGKPTHRDRLTVKQH
jgi:hypothetical protein